LEELERELNEIRGESDDFIIDHRALEYLMLLGSGASGDVYKGLYRGNPVAIKRLKEMAPTEEVEEFKKEFEILAKVRHPNVVFFFGASTQPVLAMVMEYCARGSLYHAMKDARFDINWGRAIGICRETTAGLMCLHGHKIFHRDLKSLNLLVTQQWRVKLCDFGLSRFDTKENMETMKQMRGTFAYVDPAVYNGGAFTAASDIYSLGIIVWEIVNRVVTGKYAQPYSEYKHIQFDFQIVVQASKSNLRPTIPDKCPPQFRESITALLDGDQDRRPSLEELSQTLDKIQADYDQDKEKWDIYV